MIQGASKGLLDKEFGTWTERNGRWYGQGVFNPWIPPRLMFMYCDFDFRLCQNVNFIVLVLISYLKYYHQHKTM